MVFWLIYKLYYTPSPLACIFGISRLYFTFILPVPVSHPVSLVSYPAVYPRVFCHSAADPPTVHCIPLHPTVFSCICTYLAVSSAVCCICCIQLYLIVIVSHAPPRKQDDMAKNTLQGPGPSRGAPLPPTSTLLYVVDIYIIIIIANDVFIG